MSPQIYLAINHPSWWDMYKSFPNILPHFIVTYMLQNGFKIVEDIMDIVDSWIAKQSCSTFYVSLLMTKMTADWGIKANNIKSFE